MVWSSAKAWHLNETKLKCENAPERFSYPVEDFLPVLQLLAKRLNTISYFSRFTT